MTTREKRRLSEEEIALLPREERERARERREREHKRRRKRSRQRSSMALVLGLIRWLPLPAAALLGEAFGWLAYHGSARTRRRLHDSLTKAFGDEITPARRRRIGRRSMMLAGRGLFSYPVLHRLGAEEVCRRVETVGVEHFEAARDGGRGVIVVGMHYGLPDVMGTYMANTFGGYAVGAPHVEDSVMGLLYDMRADLGCATIRRGETKKLLEALRANEHLGMLVDHDMDDMRGAFVPFFGRPAHTVTGHAALAIRTGAPLIFVATEWVGLTRHRLRFDPPFEPRTDLPRKEAVLELAYQVNRRIEEAIRRLPDHWMWRHRRWETRPEDHPDAEVYVPEEPA